MRNLHSPNLQSDPPSLAESVDRTSGQTEASLVGISAESLEAAAEEVWFVDSGGVGGASEGGGALKMPSLINAAAAANDRTGTPKYSQLRLVRH